MEIKDSGNRRQFETGAVRDMQEGKGRYDLMPMEALRRLAVHCEKGALKYGERNCEKGIPVSSLADSAMRHLCKYISGAVDEDHLTAAFWNIAFIMLMEKEYPRAEICNLPWQVERFEQRKNINIAKERPKYTERVEYELKENCGTCRYYGYSLEERINTYCVGCSAPEYKYHSIGTKKAPRKEAVKCQEETQI